LSEDLFFHKRTVRAIKISNWTSRPSVWAMFEPRRAQKNR